MPQLTLEYSNNISEKNNFSQLFQQCHKLLAEELPTELASCKSRAVACEAYTVGDGQPDNAFVHVDLKVMSGRTQDTLQHIGHGLMKILTDNFAESLQKLNLQITLEIGELQSNYFKVVAKEPD